MASILECVIIYLMIKELFFGFLGLVLGLLLGVFIAPNPSSPIVGTLAVVGLFTGVILSVWFNKKREDKKFTGDKDWTTAAIIAFGAYMVFQIARDINQGAVSLFQIYLGVVAVVIIWIFYPLTLKQLKRSPNVFPEKQMRFRKTINVFITVSVIISIVLYFFLRH